MFSMEWKWDFAALKIDWQIFKFDIDALEAAANVFFDTCPAQELLLVYARAFQFAAWLPANLGAVWEWYWNTIIVNAFNTMFAVPIWIFKTMFATQTAASGGLMDFFWGIITLPL